MSHCTCCASSSSGLDGAHDADRRSETGTPVQMECSDVADAFTSLFRSLLP